MRAMSMALCRIGVMKINRGGLKRYKNVAAGRMNVRAWRCCNSIA